MFHQHFLLLWGFPNAMSDCQRIPEGIFGLPFPSKSINLHKSMQSINLPYKSYNIPELPRSPCLPAPGSSTHFLASNSFWSGDTKLRSVAWAPGPGTQFFSWQPGFIMGYIYIYIMGITGMIYYHRISNMGSHYIPHPIPICPNWDDI